MERRDFLTLCATTAATANAVAAAPLAGILRPEPVALPPAPDMDAYIARVDAGLERVRNWAPFGDAGADLSDRASLDAMLHTGMQSLFLTGMLGDLPIPLQVDERMQERIVRAAPVFDEAHDRTTAFLQSLTDERLEKAQAALRDASTRRRLIDGIDLEAEKTGVSDARRAQTRALLEHVSWRLANQSPRLLVDEYLEKVQKVVDTKVETDAHQRQLVARIGEEAFWAIDERSKRDARINRGLKVMGIGALVTGAGGVVVAAGAFAGVFAMTAGVITFLIGFVILLVGFLTPEEKPNTALAP